MMGDKSRYGVRILGHPPGEVPDPVRVRACRERWQAESPAEFPVKLVPRLWDVAAEEAFDDEDEIVMRMLSRTAPKEVPTSPLDQALEKLNHHLGELSLLEDRARALCSEVLEEQDMEATAYQIPLPHENMIETISGDGKALDWVGLAAHPLPPEGNIVGHLDIQADIFQSRRGEVIRGEDPRFDQYMFRTFHHEEALRAFLPVVVLRDPISGHVRGGGEIRWQVSSGGERLFIQPLDVPGQTLETIGTLEAGFLDGKHHEIDENVLLRLATMASHHAPLLRAATLTAALERIAKLVIEMAEAESASIHLLRRPFEAPTDDTAFYTYNVVVGHRPHGRSSEGKLKGGISDPPRRGGLGDRALANGRPCFIPDPANDDGPNALQKYNPKIWNVDKVRAMVAFPLLARTSVGIEKLGVLYVHHLKPHVFDPRQVAEIQRLVQTASDGIRVAIERGKERERWRQNSSLVKLLRVSLQPESITLESVAWYASNVLRADVVGIYRHDRHELHLFQNGQELLPEAFVKDAAIEIMSRDQGQGLLASDVKARSWLAGPNELHDQIEHQRITSAAGLSIRGQRRTRKAGMPMAGLYIGFRGYRSFEGSEAEVIQTLGALVGAVLDGRPPDAQQLATAFRIVEEPRTKPIA